MTNQGRSLCPVATSTNGQTPDFVPIPGRPGLFSYGFVLRACMSRSTLN
jgi:hypothetical protein